jgi:hypothetical protein
MSKILYFPSVESDVERRTRAVLKDFDSEPATMIVINKDGFVVRTNRKDRLHLIGQINLISLSMERKMNTGV